jgi:DNA repair protein RecN (Recombination protein N)
MEFNPERLGELRSRGLALTRLKKKYGPNLADVIVKFQEIEAKIGPEGDIDSIITSKEKELDAIRKELSLLAAKMSEARQKAAKKFEKEIIAILHELGMGDTRFEVRFSFVTEPNEDLPFVEITKKKYQLYRWGIDKIEFYISTNKGEELKPLARIASGGEVSRVMLALKSVLSKSDNIPVLVFDEIDTGISGRIAQKVGKAMKQLGAEHQVIAITHLGQIASFADAHYLVEKKSTKNSTLTSIRHLSDDEHHNEIARIISGENVTPESLGAAKALKQEARELVG